MLSNFWHGRIVALSSVVGAIVLFAAGSASAFPVLFHGASGQQAAQALFEVNGTNLVVTLTNTSTSDVTDPADILTGVFFNVAPAKTINLKPVSAVVPTGSSVVFGGTDPGGVVGGEWAYADNLSGAPGNRKYGISSSGLGLFGPKDLFPGSNLQGPKSPDGLQYGITSAGDNTNTGNQEVTGSNALIKNSVVFTFSGLPANFADSNQIVSAWFQYGTALCDGGFIGTTPEPAAGIIFVLGIGTMLCVRKRRHSVSH